MVQVEGLGKRKPSALEEVLTDSAMRILVAAANSRAKFRGYRSGETQWQRGLTGGISIMNVGTISPEATPIAIGLFGEYACAVAIDKHCGTKTAVDLMLRINGDGGRDLVVGGVAIQVKTRKRDTGSHLVRAFNERGQRIQNSASMFAFCTWSVGHRIVSVDGCLPRSLVEAMPVVEAVRGTHRNYEVNDCELLPMARLFAEIRSKQWR